MVVVPPAAISDSNADTEPAPGHISAPASPRPSPDIIETNIPARLDALPWGRFHMQVVVALGVTWILDGLEVTMTGALSGVLKQSTTLGLSNAEIGLAASAYLVGAVSGALFFGWLTDRLGRKKLFFITLTVYLVATAATALSWNFWSFALFRLATGAGIGGEYTAINSTIQELIPARVRGWTDLVINGSFWIGAAIGAVAAIVLLDPTVMNPAIGWRVAFLIGAVLGLVILVMRLWIPESPRWLMTHGIRSTPKQSSPRSNAASVSPRCAHMTAHGCDCAGAPTPRLPRSAEPCFEPTGSAPWSALPSWPRRPFSTMRSFSHMRWS